MKFIGVFSFYLITASFFMAQSRPKKTTKPPLKDARQYLRTAVKKPSHNSTKQPLKKLLTANPSGYRGANLGLLFGSILSFNEIASDGLGFGANVEWTWSKHLASSLVFSTGNLSGKDVILNGTISSTSTMVNIKQSSANTMGFISFALGGRFYYPMGKFNPGFGVYFDFTQFRGPSYTLSSSFSVKFEFVAWYNIWKQLDIGLDLFYGLGSITKISDSSDTYALSSSLSGNSLNILLAARYRVFNL